MDTTKAVTHVGLCAGYGGIELGLKRAIPDLRTVALCEIEAFAVSNLVAKMEAGLMDPAPIWPNLKTFPWEAFRDRVDILTGGYPCQPFSAAGQRKGKQDPRHLWPWIADGIRLLRPRICFFENVEGHISLGLSDVIEDLAGMGYRTTWGIFSASECGAPHQRKRVFILAYADGERGQGSKCFLRDVGQVGQGRENSAADSDIGDAWPSRPYEQQHGWEPPRVVGPAGEELGNTKGGRRGESGHQTCEGEGYRTARTGRSNDQFSQTQPPLGGDTDGSAGGMDYAELCVSCDNRTDELRLLGNGVVPHTAELAFRVLIQELANE